MRSEHLYIRTMKGGGEGKRNVHPDSPTPPKGRAVERDDPASKITILREKSGVR